MSGNGSNHDGSAITYRRGCRCGGCVAAYEIYSEKRRCELIIDEVAIERVITGQAVQLTRLERRAAVVEMCRRGWNDRQMGDRLGLTADAVAHLRKRHGIEQRRTA